MRMSDDDFDRCMAVLIAGVGRPMPAEQVDIWREFFADMAFDELKRGIILCLRDYKYAGFPPVGLIRQAAGIATGVPDGDTAAILAWDRVIRGMREHGAVRSVDWGDPAIPLAIESAAGSWDAICLIEIDELHNFTRKRFLDAYKAHRAAGTKGDGISTGLIAADAGRIGFDTPPPARIGEQPKSVYGFVSEKPVKALPGPTKLLTNSMPVVDDEPEPHKPRNVCVGEGETVEEFEARKAEMIRRAAVKFAPVSAFVPG